MQGSRLVIGNWNRKHKNNSLVIKVRANFYAVGMIDFVHPKKRCVNLTHLFSQILTHLKVGF